MTEQTIPTQERRLTGHLGPVGIVFMVVAAAAPLTVIGGNMPLAMGLGNGAGAPVGFPDRRARAACLQHRLRDDDAARPRGRRLLLVRDRRPRPADWEGHRGGGTRSPTPLSRSASTGTLDGRSATPWASTAARKYLGLSTHSPILAIVALLGYRHIELSAKVLGVALALEISIVVLLDLAIVAKPGPAGLTLDSFRPEVFTQGSLGIAVLFALTGFIGFEATAVFRDEARDPERTIPRATYAAVLIIGAFYAVTCWAFVVALGPDQVAAVAQRTLDGDGNMLLDTTDATLGRVGRDVVNVLLLTSLFACVLSFHNVIARYQFVLAGKGLLPRRLASVVTNATTRRAFSSLVQTVTAAVIVRILRFSGSTRWWASSVRWPGSRRWAW